MKRVPAKVGMFFAAGILLAISLGVTRASAGQGFDDRLGSISRPDEFSTVKWSSAALLGQVKEAIFNRPRVTGSEADRVVDYFASVRSLTSLESRIEAAGGNISPALNSELERLKQQTAAAKSAVAGIIGRQLRETLSQQGIFNPVDRYLRLRISFPPVNFAMDKLPRLLVISPRERIEQVRSITLRSDLTMAEMERIEAEVDKLGVASLIVDIGGYAGTYPTFVTDRADLRFTIETVAHEWLHQYLAFKPLGFAYLLHLTGLSRNYEIATINETVASMAGKEIASLLYSTYYVRYETDTKPKAPVESEFNREMREIRKTVDQYLARGEIELAEGFMEQRRHYLVSKGYYIRKLNQAYFAFNGTYADGPASVSPIGSEMRQLRSRQASLKDFLDTVSAITRRGDLASKLK